MEPLRQVVGRLFRRGLQSCGRKRACAINVICVVSSCPSIPSRSGVLRFAVSLLETILSSLCPSRSHARSAHFLLRLDQMVLCSLWRASLIVSGFGTFWLQRGSFGDLRIRRLKECCGRRFWRALRECLCIISCIRPCRTQISHGALFLSSS